MKKLGIILAVVLLLAGVFTIVTACGTKYDLSYESWDLGTDITPTIERKMVQEFEKLHNVKIELKEASQGNAYESGITGQIARGDAPDVFKITNTNFVLSNTYALDVSTYANADEDWGNIPASLEEAVHFKSGIYAIPFSMHMAGYFVNVTLLKENGISFPAKDKEVTWEKLYEVIAALKNATNEAGDALLGLSQEESIIEWYPASANKNYGHFTWDGQNFHLDSEEFIAGIDVAKDIYTKRYSWDSLTETDYTTTFEGINDGYVELWNSGRLAVRWGYTYEMPDMMEHNPSDNEIRFIGIPTVADTTRFPNARTQNYANLIGDYVSIYKDTKNPELAYEFAKWMSFDPAGIAKRIELERADGKQVTNSIPLTSDEATLEKYFETFDAIEGVEKMFKRLDQATLEPTKVFPGYTKARWQANTGLTVPTADGSSIASANMGEFLVACRQGFYDYRGYASQANEKANAQYGETVSGYEGKYK